MGPHRKLGIYVGFQSPSIIKFLEPLTGDLLTARHADCIFNEHHFPALGEIIRITLNARKSIGMLNTSPRRIPILRNLNYKFRGS
jgi:hypothetical protein